MDTNHSRRAILAMHLDATLWREGSWWIAVAPSLGVASQGKTQKSALVNLSEAVELFIETAHEMGALDQILKQSGIKPAMRPPRGARKHVERMAIPMPFSLFNARHAQAA